MGVRVGGAEVFVGGTGVLVAGLLGFDVAVGCGALVDTICVAAGGFVGVAATLVGTCRVAVGAPVGVLPGRAVPGGAAVPGGTAVAEGSTLVGSDWRGSLGPRRSATSLSGGSVGAGTAVGVVPGIGEPAGATAAS